MQILLPHLKKKIRRYDKERNCPPAFSFSNTTPSYPDTRSRMRSVTLLSVGCLGPHGTHWRMGRWDLGLIAIVRPNSVLTPNEELEPHTSESVLTSQRESPLARFVPLSEILVVPLWLFALLLPSGKPGLKAAELYVVKYMYPLDKYSLLHPAWPSPGHQMNRQTQLLSWNLLSWKCTSVMISL